jgi:hypothetical protein
MRKTVDVLTMSATPIPRTLHMRCSPARHLIADDGPAGSAQYRHQSDGIRFAADQAGDLRIES